MSLHTLSEKIKHRANSFSRKEKKYADRRIKRKLVPQNIIQSYLENSRKFQ